MPAGRIKDTILLFDVDGTLTENRQLIQPSMYDFIINEVKPKIPIGLVSGSDLDKIVEQMGGEKIMEELDYIFPENGLVAYKHGELIGTQSIQEYMGDDKLQKLINFCLGYMSKLQLPVKRGTFIEFRNGMLNICPIGRSCSLKERREFYEYDKVYHIREKFVQTLKQEFPDYDLLYPIGGEISFDIFPAGWDKTFCLNYLTHFSNIHFFGDQVWPEKNDYEIYHDERTTGHYVQNPNDTYEKVNQLLETLWLP